MIKAVLRRMVPAPARRQLRSAVQRVVAPIMPEEANLILPLCSATPFDPNLTMVDVGACHGRISAPFAKMGWRVFAFEPDPNNRRILAANLGGLSNVSIDQRAVSEKTESGLPFYASELSAGISGLSAFDSTHKLIGTVDTVSLAAFCEDASVSAIEFLKIDTEGFDLFALKGIAWNRLKPRLILCEFEDAKTKPLGYTFHDMARYLTAQGYRVMVSEWYPIANRGKGYRWRRFADYPCELEDGNCWGNLIGAAQPADFEALKRVAARMARKWRLSYHIGRALFL